MTQQIETLTVVGAITQSGNALVTITSSPMGSVSPKPVLVAVTIGDDASAVAAAARFALAFDADVSAPYLVSGAGANIALTRRINAANDSALNIAIDNATCTGLTPVPTSTHTLAGSGLLNAYCSLADYKSFGTPMGQTATPDANDDAVIESLINSASRYIDRQTGRYFYKSAADETKYFSANNQDRILVGDFVSITTLKTDTLSGKRSYPYQWAATDYDLWPYDAGSDKPYRYIDRSPRGLYLFPKRVAKGVMLTAIFGWPAIPNDISDACKMIVQGVYSLRSGQASSGKITVTSAGVVIRPEEVPAIARSIIANYLMAAV